MLTIHITRDADTTALTGRKATIRGIECVIEDARHVTRTGTWGVAIQATRADGRPDSFGVDYGETITIHSARIHAAA